MKIINLYQGETMKKLLLMLPLVASFTINTADNVTSERGGDFFAGAQESRKNYEKKFASIRDARQQKQTLYNANCAILAEQLRELKHNLLHTADRLINIELNLRKRGLPYNEDNINLYEAYKYLINKHA